MVLGSDNPFAPSVGSFQVPVVAPDGDPDAGNQITVCFAADWLPVVVGALQQLTLQATWQGDAAAVRTAQDRAQLLIAMFGAADGGCTAAVCVQGLVYDADCDCVLQTLDGGETYTPNPLADPRHGESFRYPPIDADDPQCHAAANAVRFVEDLIDEVLLVVDQAGTAAGLTAFIMPFFLELGPFGLLIDVALGLFFTLFSAGATAIAAAFPSTVYDTLTCILFCNMSTDGQISAAQLDAINVGIDSDIGGLAATILHGILAVTGEVGLSNAGAQGDAPADCSGCAECDWCVYFDFSLGDQGWNTAEGNPNFLGLCGLYSTGVGWLETLGSDNSGGRGQQLWIQRYFNAHVTSVQVTYDRTAGQYTAANSSYALYHSPTNVQSPGTNLVSVGSPGTSGTGLVQTWTGSADVTGLTIRLMSSYRTGNVTPSPTGSGTVKSVMLTGTGENPFPELACP